VTTDYCDVRTECILPVIGCRSGVWRRNQQRDRNSVQSELSGLLQAEQGMRVENLGAGRLFGGAQVPVVRGRNLTRYNMLYQRHSQQEAQLSQRCRATLYGGNAVAENEMLNLLSTLKGVFHCTENRD